MASYPIEIRRCQHIRTSGTQCGSPALRNETVCYYHKHNPARPVELFLEGDRYPDLSNPMPPFEDAHSIQMALRQVVQLMMAKRIERKDAGLVLYALQIASSNLKMMKAERPRPTQVVVEPEKTAETPLGMTPWSAKGEGHEVEEPAGEAGDEAERAVREANEHWETRYRGRRDWMMKKANSIGEWLDGKREAHADELWDLLGGMKDSLEAEAREMAGDLAGVG